MAALAVANAVNNLPAALIAKTALLPARDGGALAAPAGPTSGPASVCLGPWPRTSCSPPLGTAA